MFEACWQWIYPSAQKATVFTTVGVLQCPHNSITAGNTNLVRLRAESAAHHQRAKNFLSQYYNHLYSIIRHIVEKKKSKRSCERRFIVLPDSLS